MTTNRWILGNRPNPIIPGTDEFGVFVSPPGVNALTATPEQLLLHVTSATAQIVMQGIASSPFPRVVPHSLGYEPIVFPNLVSTKLSGGTFSYVRPFDNTFPPYTNSYAQSNISDITFLQSGVVLDINFFVFNKERPQ